MAKFEPTDIRTLALIGHSHSGKTTLGEGLLLKAKATNRLGRMDQGTTVFDFEPEEKERNTSIDLSVASLSFEGKEIQIVDTPGFSDFVADAISALSAVETAVLCIHSAAGIMVNTRKMWKRAVDRGCARVICLTKLDADNAQFLPHIEAI